MKRHALVLAVGLAAANGSPVLAEEAPAAESPHGLGGSLILMSDYRSRGISQTDDGPALQGILTYSYEPANLSLGVQGYSIDSAGYDGASMELDAFASWTPSWDALELDIGWIYYGYPKTHTSAYNTHEFHVAASYDLGTAVPKFAINFSPDWYGGGDSWYYDLSLKVPLPQDFALTLHYGWNRFDHLYKDYEDWSIGVSKSWVGLDFSLSYVDTAGLDKDLDCGSPFKCGGTLVFSVAKSF